MKNYEVFSKQDFVEFYAKIYKYMRDNEMQGNKFIKLNVVVKRWRKDKTPKQHKYYWLVISEMKKAFLNVGYEFSIEEIHEFVKKEHNFIRTVTLKNGKTICVTKSIADDSEDINVKAMVDLIDFAIRWTAINLNWVIDDPRKTI